MEIDVPWSRLNIQLQAIFAGHYRSSLAVQASFDDEAEAKIMLSELVGSSNNITEADIDRLSSELVVWSAQFATTFKSMRTGLIKRRQDTPFLVQHSVSSSWSTVEMFEHLTFKSTHVVRKTIKSRQFKVAKKRAIQ